MKSLNKYINIKIRHYSRISGTEPGNFCLFLCSKDQPIDRYSGNVESENNIIMSLVEKFYILMNIQAKFYKINVLKRMKKIYVKPTLTVDEMEPCTIMAGSSEFNGNSEDLKEEEGELDW